MKTISKVMSLILVIIFMNAVATAQEKTAVPDKKTQKEITKDIEKNSKTEAKKWKKEGYTNPIGTPSLEMQFKKSFTYQSENLESGHPKYIIGTGNATGETASAAKMQAMQAAKLSIADQISSEVALLVNSIISNQQINMEEAASVTKTMTDSKSLVAQTLGRTITLVEATKPVGKNINYNLVLAYDYVTAKDVAKDILRKQLEQDSKLMKETIDKVTNF